jgi:anti-sigma-K factor RskA
MNPATPDDRRDELQADRALFGLSAAEVRELAALGGDDNAVAPDGQELAAAALDLSLHAATESPLPAHLKQRILAASKSSPPPAANRSPSMVVAASSPHAAMSRRREALAWLAAAAAVLIAAWVGMSGRDDALTPAQLRGRLLAARRDRPGDVLQIAWTRGADPAGAAAEGDVVWSAADQSGVMRFVGLAANDPRREQYQLWIFDAERDERYPVDGGVFDVPADAAEVLVPIRAKLPVARPTLFAVTVERPGGVVVSDRSRLPLLAPTPK